jgi:drug/metabolite transporter (DMT)-like permease
VKLQLARRPTLLLSLLVMIWAISWPVLKIGIAGFTPIWYACLRFSIASLCLFVLLLFRGTLHLPSRTDWRLVIVCGALQSAAFSVFVNLALTRLPPGRSAVLAYCTPLWVAPMAAWWLHEQLKLRAVIGICLGLSGIVVLVAPAILASDRVPAAPYLLLLGASLAWAISIVAVRAHPFESNPLELAPWQMLVASLLTLIVALFVEGSPSRISGTAVATLVYVAPLATAFAYWAVVECGRHFRASTLSVALLATPAVGVLVSAVVVKEPITLQLLAAMALIAVGVRIVTADR